MPIGPGARVGPYEVIASLGAGGMGEVYRARDTRLHRDVALKVLPDAFLADADRLARFQREAQALAALNHPNIAQIYGIEETPGEHALVLELVEGSTLADRIAQGPVPVEEAMAIARQMATALEAAHEQGIIHRDLKPANIKIRPDGTVKVLDFGLAKLRGDTPAIAGGTPGSSLAATITTPAMTGIGVILGTAAYMAPEQARGKAIDRRADVWGFGCVLFEMLTGHRAFGGDDVAETIGAVIHKEPDWTALPATTPSPMRVTVRRCLHKDPAGRLRDIGDVRLALEGAFERVAADGAAARALTPRRGLLLVAAAVLGALVAGTAVWTAMRRPADQRRALHFQLALPQQATLGFFALSPDGAHLAYTARQGVEPPTLWVHSFETGRSRQLMRAEIVDSPLFWSPDSRFIGFLSRGTLMRTDVDDSPPGTITTVENLSGGTWAPDGTVIFGRRTGPLLRVPAAGGEPVPLTALDSSREETVHAGPSMLPDGRRFLYVRLSRNAANSGVYVGALDAAVEAQPPERLLATQQNVFYMPSGDGETGFVVFLRDGIVMAQRIDPAGPTLMGEPVSVAEGAGVLAGVYGLFSVSPSGMLAYRAGENPDGGTPTWVDRDGREIGPLPGAAGTRALYPRVSPDGSQVAAVVDGDIWVYHVDGRPPIKVTANEVAFSPVWSPDGLSLVYETSAGSGLGLVAADGSATTARPASPPGHFHPHAWTADGRELVIGRIDATANSTTDWDILRIRPGEAAEPAPIVQTEAREGLDGVALSPDGRWLAYTSDVTGAMETWVRPFPGPGAPVRVSANGGREPTWSRKGDELFFLEGSRLMAVRVNTRAAFTFAPPALLFDLQFYRSSQPPTYDVAPDGRFLVLESGPTAAPPLEVIIDWPGLLRTGR